jgi:hypothetical protein
MHNSMLFVAYSVLIKMGREDSIILNVQSPNNYGNNHFHAKYELLSSESAS